jgi:hypothetical protein
VSIEQQREDLTNAAIIGGHVRALQWLRRRQLFLLDTGVMRFEGDLWSPSQLAALFGHYDMVKYLYEQDTHYVYIMKKRCDKRQPEASCLSSRARHRLLAPKLR